jgi:hypothetical protein
MHLTVGVSRAKRLCDKEARTQRMVHLCTASVFALRISADGVVVGQLASVHLCEMHVRKWHITVRILRSAFKIEGKLISPVSELVTRYMV